MSLVEEINEARGEFARATYALDEFRNSLESKVGMGRAETGVELKQREQSVVAAKENLGRVQQDVLERARAIVNERDPAYAAELAAAKLLPEVEQTALVGAADRLTSA